MGRIDDVINTAGHRLSTGQLEEVISTLDFIAECAVIGIKDALKGEIPVAIIVLKSGFFLPSDDIEKTVILKVRNDIGPVAALKTVLIVPRLPKTLSGKILRGTMKKIAEMQKYAFPASIETPESLEEVKREMERKELGREIDIKFEGDLEKTAKQEEKS